MPVVSQRNAIFMENEINGIHVEEDIIQRFAGLDREQGEALGLEVSMQMAREALPYADGFYLMTPFNRVAPDGAAYCPAENGASGRGRLKKRINR